VFKLRLTYLLGCFALAGVAIAARLTQLQVFEASHYRAEADAVIKRRPQTLPFVRGRILDRTGTILAADEPTWDVRVDYGIIAAGQNPDESAVRPYLRSVRTWPRFQGAADDQIIAALKSDVQRTWRELAAFEGVSPGEIEQRRAQIHARVQRIRDIVADYWQFDRPVREEREAHPLIAGLPESRQIEARQAFAEFSWVEVRSSSQRVQPGGAALTHLLGRTAAVDRDTLRDDPDFADPFARYLPDEVHGITGVEWLEERRLRGRRGQLVRDADGRLLEAELVEPINGDDVRLTVRADLQQRLFELLAAATLEHPEVPGGAIVVVHVPTRDVLAMVTYPSYDAADFARSYNALRDDTGTLPLRFRAASNVYAPGSIIKPLVCLAGLNEGKIGLDTRITCEGYLFPDRPDARTSRCWESGDTGVRHRHGPVNVEEALRGSCNVFMYHLGMDLGLESMTTYFHLAGLGSPTGVGLREEATGWNPDPYWMAERDRAVTPGILRLLAMGQGDVMVTPLQAANLMATYAEGQFRPLRIIADRPIGPASFLPATHAHWAAIRNGMYQVVNHPEGTAYKHAYWRNARYALCGKTGSATAPPRPTRYRITTHDGAGAAQTVILPGGSSADARQRFAYEYGRELPDDAVVEPVEFWPPGAAPTDQEAHAWFGGFLQPLDGRGRPDWTRPAPIAFAVLLEYGHSGGGAGGPVGRRVAELLIDVLGPELDPDAPELLARHP